MASVYEVLTELEAVDKPIITVLNKADRVRPEDMEWLCGQVPNPVVISATQATGLDKLLAEIQPVVQAVRPDRQRYSA